MTPNQVQLFSYKDGLLVSLTRDPANPGYWLLMFRFANAGEPGFERVSGLTSEEALDVLESLVGELL